MDQNQGEIMVKVAAIQMQCDKDININLNKAEKMIREAAKQQAQIILLPELSLALASPL